LTNNLCLVGFFTYNYYFKYYWLLIYFFICFSKKKTWSIILNCISKKNIIYFKNLNVGCTLQYFQSCIFRQMDFLPYYEKHYLDYAEVQFVFNITLTHYTHYVKYKHCLYYVLVRYPYHRIIIIIIIIITL